LVPGLVVLFDFVGVEAVGTATIALLAIGLNGARAYDRDGLVDRPAAGWLALTSAPTALLFGWLVAGRLDADVFVSLLGVLLILLAVLVAFGRTIPQSAPDGEPGRGALLGGGLVVGAVSGTFAVGAGLLTVPLMMRVRHLQAHRAAATTAAAGIAGSLAATIGHTLASNVVWAKLPPLLLGALVGSTLGARMAGRLSAREVTNLLVAGLITAAIPLLFKAVG
ncbi:MAG: sulfite exporter TauE/SafE family protein, partial [Acidimicrobiales bacterium]